MARFHFRLDASLRLAEQALKAAQRVFALEVQRWQILVKACAVLQTAFKDAQAGQREAGRNRPEDLGVWRVYAEEQLRRLRQKEKECREQEEVMEAARRVLLEAHREVEKFSRLKEKQRKAFELEEARKEQKVLDETGQVLHWRQQNTEMTEGKEDDSSYTFE